MEYQKVGDVYVLRDDGGRVLGRYPEVAISYSIEPDNPDDFPVPGTLHRHGDPEVVARWMEDTVRVYREEGFYSECNSLRRFKSGKWDLEELNKILNITGYVGLWHFRDRAKRVFARTVFPLFTVVRKERAASDRKDGKNPLGERGFQCMWRRGELSHARCESSDIGGSVVADTSFGEIDFYLCNRHTSAAMDRSIPEVVVRHLGVPEVLWELGAWRQRIKTES